MKIDILKESDTYVSFLIEGVKPSFLSPLRRIMVSEIPTMAIAWVEFKKNDSLLNDEVIANRLGQIPLTFNTKFYDVPSKEDIEKDRGKNLVKFVLKKKGPTMVYSGDLKSTAKDVKAVFDNIPITELFEGQELQFEATAHLGTGREHAKWQGATVGYRNKVNVTVGKDVENKVEHAKVCPVDVFDVKNNRLISSRPLDCILCMKCVEVSDGKIKVSPIEDSFIVNVETVCGLKAREVVSMSANILDGKISDFSKAVKKLK